MNKPVPLIRRFTAIPESYQDDQIDLQQVWGMLGDHTRHHWGELREQFRVVILADAGAGKTFELKAEAQKLVASGSAAFFIRIEDIDAAFGSAFEVGTPQAFENWLAGTGEAWFFLDSIDEVRLDSPRAFEAAISAFAARIHDAWQRAHVYISSRPYAWRSGLDRALVDELLPYEPPTEEPGGEGDDTNNSENGHRQTESIKLYRLAPLDPDDIRIFAGHRDIDDADDLLAALERRQLFEFAQLPFDLEEILVVWRQIGALDSRLAVLEHALEISLSPPRHRLSALSLAKANDGARRLALAVTLTGQTNIRLPGTDFDGLDATAVLPSWSEDEIRQLLDRGIFSDAIYSMTRFRHREIRELLAARRFDELLKKADARPAIEQALFAESYGQKVIVPRTRPVLNWLMLFDPQIRDQALSLEPEIATEGGDPALLPIDVRRKVLRDMVARILAGESHRMDFSEVARIAHADLSDDVLEFLEAHFENEQVLFFLGRLIWQGGMVVPALRLKPVVLDMKRNLYSRIISVRAIAAIEDHNVLFEIWDKLNRSGEVLSRRLMAEFVDGAPAEMRSVGHLLASLDFVEPFERFDPNGFGQAIEGLVDRLPLTTDSAPQRPLVTLVDGLADFLGRPPYVERRECRVSEANSWLMGPALGIAQKLISGRSKSAVEAAVLSTLAQVPALRHWSDRETGNYKSKLRETVPRWVELNDALFWHTVELARAGRKEDDPRVELWDVAWLNHFWAFDNAAFPRVIKWISMRANLDDRAIALSLAFRLYLEAGRLPAQRRQLWRAVKGEAALEEQLGKLMRPPRSTTRQRLRANDRKWEKRQREREENEAGWRRRFVERLKANPEVIRIAPGLSPGEMSRDQAIVLQSIEGDGMRISRGVGARWQELIPEFGEAVAEAFRDGAVRHWRLYRPRLRSEGENTNSIPYALIFAMAGLEIEAGENELGLIHLSDDEARLALRYALWELNGFPAWFEPLYRAHPEAGLELIWGETKWQLINSQPDENSHYVLQDLVYHAPWLHAEVSAPIYEWLFEHGAANADVLRYSRAIMFSGGLASDKVAELARKWAQDEQTPIDQRPTWFAIWVESDPAQAIPALENSLARMVRPDDARFAEQFIVSLLGERRGGGSSLGHWRAPGFLKVLYILMHRHIRLAEDIHHESGRSYSPGMRDDAQDARARIFNILAATPGEEAHRAILELADDHPEESSRTWMKTEAYRRAVTDSDRSWTIDEVNVLSMGN